VGNTVVHGLGGQHVETDSAGRVPRRRAAADAVSFPRIMRVTPWGGRAEMGIMKT
jgi:hypothetical protein